MNGLPSESRSKLSLALGLVLFVALVPRPSLAQAEQCTVTQILQPRNVPTGTLAVNAYGGLTEISRLLVPTTIDRGRYEIMISQTRSNLYEAPNYDVYLKTSACLKMAAMRTVVLEVPDSETSAGTLFFPD